MATLNYDMKSLAGKFRQDNGRGSEARWTILSMMILYASHEMLFYNNVPTFMRDTGFSKWPTTEAIQWLIAHDALVLVKPEDRWGKSAKFSARKNVYFITGIIVLDGQVYRTAFVPEENHEWHVEKLIDLGCDIGGFLKAHGAKNLHQRDDSEPDDNNNGLQNNPSDMPDDVQKTPSGSAYSVQKTPLDGVQKTPSNIQEESSTSFTLVGGGGGPRDLRGTSPGSAFHFF